MRLAGKTSGKGKEKIMKKDNFNIIITGVGGQGLITLLQVIARAGFNEGLDVRTSELHGLSQRGGSVSVHIRTGKQVFSPIIPKTKANLVIALEFQEALAGAEFANKHTAFLVNKHQTATLAKSISEKEVEKVLKKITKKVKFIPGFDICSKQFGTAVTAGVYLLGLAVYNKHIPFSEQQMIKAMKDVMPERFWELNIKTFKLAKQYDKL